MEFDPLANALKGKNIPCRARLVINDKVVMNQGMEILIVCNF